MGDLTVFIMGLISSLDIVSVVFPDPKVFGELLHQLMRVWTLILIIPTQLWSMASVYL